MWVALNLQTSAQISLLGNKVEIPVSGMAEGCVGCLLVFESSEQAAGYVGDGGNVVEIDFKALLDNETAPTCQRN